MGRESKILGRSIPACAGEPSTYKLVKDFIVVYPRVCGGTQGWAARCERLRGLSPRVRGNPRARVPAPPWPGSIPACAGEPVWPSLAAVRLTVYPRVCGGTAIGGAKAVAVLGLSPRVRGNHGTSKAERVTIRSIPACAGEPVVVVIIRSIRRVYPRVCGGTRREVLGASGREGLSPRVRGNPVPHMPEHPRRRSIPACAGEP